MEKEFIPYEEALVLKELGFNEPCLAIYISKKRIIPAEDFETNTELESKKEHDLHGIGTFEYEGSLEEFYKTDARLCLTAPTFSQAFRWFREKHGICSWIQRLYNEYGNPYYTIIHEYKTDLLSRNHTVVANLKEYNTYEEAEQACLDKLIQLVKNE